ncbi:helicase-associated domain-containing protein [Saccharothrix sp. Mg75]|uniref:helicase-associated domain-containing protein n=1 Tax=Saccharothrix sp. Mg75 TaxID=3445357 RepID=UPI003EE9A104
MGRKSALVAWLRALDAPELREVLALRRDAARARPRTVRALADELTTASSLRRAVDGLDRACRDVLDTAVRLGEGASTEALAEALRCNGKAARAELKRVLGVLRAHALVWPAEPAPDPAGPSGPAAAPALVTSPGLRPSDGEPARRVTPAPRAPRRARQDRGFADRAATAPATSTVDGVTRLVELCDTRHVACGSGVGLRELRRVAAALGVEEDRARLWLELAAEARLLGVDEDSRRLVPTGSSDRWRAAPPAARLAALADAWPRMTWAAVGQRAALAGPPPAGAGDRARRGVLERYARLAPDEAFEHRHEVVADLVWSRPAVHDPAATGAVLAEAESVGLVALGALSALGRAVLGGTTAAVADRFVPPAATTAHLRPDLTAAVAGLPSRELCEVLDLAADAASGGWRFSGASVRRALDAGHEPGELLARLGSAASHGVPPALERLVHEVARQRGQVAVTAVACCVRAEDPVLLAEIAGHRALAGLSLHPLAPTVLASARPVPETMALLRAAGYAPTSDGGPFVARVPRRRVEPPPPAARAPLTGNAPAGNGLTGSGSAGNAPTGGEPTGKDLTEEELTALAAALVDRERPHPATPQVRSRRTGAVRLLRDQSLVLRDSEVVLLADALVSRTSVEIAVANGPRTTVRHVVTPVDHAAGNLTATTDAGHREFPVSRIRSVRPVPSAT